MKDNHSVNIVYTNLNCYTLESLTEYSKLKKNFIKEHLADKSIDHIRYPKLSNFIIKSTYFLGAVDFTDELPMGGFLKYVNNNKIIGHIDQVKCYFNVDKCSLYEGYLGKITDFRTTDKIHGIGIYQIYNINTDNADKKFLLYCNKLKILKDFSAYPTPLLKLFDLYNVKYKILQGCWGTNFDFKLTEEFAKVKVEIDSNNTPPALLQ